MPSDDPRIRKPQFAPFSIAVTLWNRKLVIGSLWLLLTGTVCAVVFHMPRFYSSEATVLIQAEGIPEQYVTPSVKLELQERLESLKQRILSHAALQQMSKDFKLYQKERKFLDSQQISEKFRDDISMKLERGWSPERPGTFKIGYIGRDPVVAAQVVNRIARFFIEENTRDRQGQANITSEFLARELQRAKDVLGSQEEKIHQYKLKFNGELPQQDSELIASVGQLKAQLTTVQEALNRAIQNKIFIESSLQSARATDLLGKRLIELEPASTAGIKSQVMAPQGEPVAREAETERLKNEIKELRRNYGEQHPEIQRLLAAYRAAKATEQAAPAAAKNIPPPTNVHESPSTPAEMHVVAMPPPAGQNESIAMLGAQLAAAKRELVDLEKERRSLSQEFKVVQRKMDKIPTHELQLSALTRDHDTAKANYGSLLEKKLSADMAAQMETRSKAARFVLLDEARVPEAPIKPNRMLLTAGGSLASLLFAFAVALGLEWRRNVILGEWELPSGVTVLGRVPHLLSEHR